MFVDTISIQYFLEVAKHLNFTKAANALYVSQPAVSRKVSNLEQELGCTLIDRTSKNMTLTSAGVLFREFFSRYTSELEEMVHKVKEMQQEQSGTIHIGMFQEWDYSAVFRPVFQAFSQEFPNISLNIETDLEKNLFRGLKHGKYDVIIGMESQLRHASASGMLPKVRSLQVIDAQKILICSKYNSAAQASTVTPQLFRDQTLYIYADENGPVGLASTIELLSSQYGFKPKYKAVSSIDAIFAALSLGSGYAIVDSMVRAINNTGFTSVKLNGYTTISMAMLDAPVKHHGGTLMNFCLAHFDHTQK